LPSGPFDRIRHIEVAFTGSTVEVSVDLLDMRGQESGAFRRGWNVITSSSLLQSHHTLADQLQGIRCEHISDQTERAMFCDDEWAIPREMVRLRQLCTLVV